MKVKKKKDGRLPPRTKFKYFRDNPKQWNDLRAGDVVDVDVEAWAKSSVDLEGGETARERFLKEFAGIEVVRESGGNLKNKVSKPGDE